MHNDPAAHAASGRTQFAGIGLLMFHCGRDGASQQKGTFNVDFEKASEFREIGLGDLEWTLYTDLRGATISA